MLVITVLMLWGIVSVAVAAGMARVGRRMPRCEAAPIRLPDTPALR